MVVFCPSPFLCHPPFFVQVRDTYAFHIAMKRSCHINRFAPLRFSNGSDFTLLAGTPDYTYDGNGNMTLDALRNISLIYDINNLVSTVSRNDTLLATYHYLADGTKYKVIDPDNNGRIYIGPFSYTTAKTGNTVYSYLEGIDTDGGRIMVVRKQSGTQNTYDYTTAFFVRDHLGSTRVMLNAQGDILERNAYYPFGLQMNQGKAYPILTQRLPQLYSGYISPTPARRDLYNGKEIQTAAGTDYLDYGFRQYDPTIARWFNIDPKAEKYLSLTPYSYCAGNPILHIDEKGDDWYVTFNIKKGGIEKQYHYTEDYRSQEDLDKAGISGQYLGLTVLIRADNLYLSLLGEKFSTKTDNRKYTAEMIINIDNAIINKYHSEELSREDLDKYNCGPTGKTDMSVYNSSKEKFHHTQASLDYAGGKVTYYISENMTGYLNWGDGKWNRRNGGILNDMGSGAVLKVETIQGSGTIVYWLFPTKELRDRVQKTSKKLLHNRNLNNTNYEILN